MAPDPTTPLATDRATARLLWDACAPQPDPTAVVDDIDSGADVARAARLAIPQSVGPLLWRGLDMAGRTDRLGEMLERLRQEHDVRRGQGGLLLPVGVARALGPLRDAGIDAVVLKGAMLASRYPAVGLRPMDDIDLLVPPDRHGAAIAALEAAGWQLHRAPGGRYYDAVLLHPGVPDLPLELHVELESWRERTTHLRAADLWAARVPTDCFGTPAFGLPVVEELLSLVVHAGKPFHHFQRLIWSVDLAVVIGAAGGELDWDRLLARARAFGAMTVLAVGMHHARRLGATVPDAALRIPDGRMRRAAVAPLLAVEWPLAPGGEGVGHRLRYGLSDLLRYQVQLSAGEIVASGWRDVPWRAGRLLLQVAKRWISPGGDRRKRNPGTRR